MFDNEFRFGGTPQSLLPGFGEWSRPLKAGVVVREVSRSLSIWRSILNVMQCGNRVVLVMVSVGHLTGVFDTEMAGRTHTTTEVEVWTDRLAVEFKGVSTEKMPCGFRWVLVVSIQRPAYYLIGA